MPPSALARYQPGLWAARVTSLPSEVRWLAWLKAATSSSRVATLSEPAPMVTLPPAASPFSAGVVPGCWEPLASRSASSTRADSMAEISGSAASLITTVVSPLIRVPSLSVTCSGRVRLRLSLAP
ncbi:hypothetical protein D3C78_1429970 [compost metagenome]